MEVIVVSSNDPRAALECEMAALDAKRSAGGRPGGFVGIVNRDIDYSCGSCGKKFPRDQLRAKRVQFTTMGKNPRVIKSRVTQWLCEPCMEADSDYTREAFHDSPGLADIRKDP